jgi:glycosyltransferase involved in cell wall biosynthesis
MKIVYACTLEFGGPLTHLLDLAPHVARLGQDVSVICANGAIAEVFRARGVDAVPLPLRHKLDVRGTAALGPALHGADVVHTHDRRAGLLVRLRARLGGAAVVHTLHGIPNEIFGLVGRADAALPPGVSPVRAAWLRYGLLRVEAALARLGTTIVPSEALYQFLLAHGFPQGRTVLIPYGVELRRTRTEPRHEPFRLATASILEHRKGVDVLLDACSRVSTPVHLDVFGEGTQRADLEAQAARNHLDARFHGYVQPLDIPGHIGGSDLFVLATRGDNLPVAVLEAMSLALPVVATRTGGLPELVADGETGLLVEPDDSDGLAEAIDRVGQDEDLRTRLGEAAARRLADRFEAATVARAIVSLYERVARTSH